MIENPGNYLEPFRKAGSDGIFIHPENVDDIGGLADQIHNLGMEAGVAINPVTGIDVIQSSLDQFERVLIMTVHPGFGGQPFIAEPLQKIVDLKNMTISWEKPPLIEVDGGIGVNTASTAVEAGADALVAGSAIFGTENPAMALKEIRKKAESVEPST